MKYVFLLMVTLSFILQANAMENEDVIHTLVSNKAVVVQRLTNGRIEFFTCSLKEQKHNHQQTISSLNQVTFDATGTCVPSFGEEISFPLEDFDFNPILRKVGAVGTGVTTAFASLITRGSTELMASSSRRAFRVSSTVPRTIWDRWSFTSPSFT